MSKDFAKTYNPQEIEDLIYKKWEESGYFNPDNLNLPENAESFTIILPPPNITAKLHMGHASMLAIEDLMIRFHRMRGFRTLWLPGTDHAAIATQNAVEKKLFKETGQTRHDLGKEEFLKKVWEFLRETQATILSQFRKMGASLDWSREAFTLDDERKKAVKKMFIEMYNEGVIYRGERIVNWCPRCHSTLADDEVEYKEQEAKLYTFRYWQNFPISISTTRPETKLGDVAVAVNPQDERYKNFIGQEFSGEFCGIPLKIKIITDREVDMNFGTGALGVTPAHSMVDWKIAEKNGLPIIKVIDEDGKIYSNFGEFSSLSAEEARKKVVEKLQENNLIEKEEELQNNLSVCYRCDTAIEPLPSKQWFISVDKKLARLGGKSLKEGAIEVAKNEEIKFLPNRFTKRYLDWMENLHDWCISRQIWFGHEIPAWYCDIPKHKMKICNKDIFESIKNGSKKYETRAYKENFAKIKSGDLIEFSLIEKNEENKVLDKTTLKVKNVFNFDGVEKMCDELGIKNIINLNLDELKNWYKENCHNFEERLKEGGIFAFELEKSTENKEIFVGEEKPEGENWQQDLDSLDTWFSSGMWSFSTLGWADNFQNGEKKGDLKKFHPTQVLETGSEILTLWVSRMIMMSLFAVGEIPFEKVYLHGTVLDKFGKKMSKSKGNGIDPVEMIQKYGADASRLSVLIGNTPGNDLKFSEEKVEQFRNFVNKFWNIGKYTSNYSADLTDLDLQKISLSVADKWILSKLAKVNEEVTENLKQYNLSLAGEILRSFTWDDFADWYVEIHKIEKNDAVLNLIYRELVKMWHPFMPFVTEKIWQEMFAKNENDLLLVEKWTEKDDFNSILASLDLRNDFDSIQDLIVKVRNIRSTYNVAVNKNVEITLTTEEKNLIEECGEIIKRLARVEKINFGESEVLQEKSASDVVGDWKLSVFLGNVIDVEKEKSRIEQDLQKTISYKESLEKRLSSSQFVEKAPKEVIEKEMENLRVAKEKVGKLEESLKGLSE